MSSCTAKMWGISGDPPENAVLPVCRVRPDLRLPLAEIGGFRPGGAVDDFSGISLVDRQVARHTRDGRMFEPIARAGSDARDLEDRRDVVLVVDAVEFGLEMLRDIHLDDIDIRHGALPSAVNFAAAEKLSDSGAIAPGFAAGETRLRFRSDRRARPLCSGECGRIRWRRACCWTSG